MILSDIRHYLRTHKQASLEELSQHFSVEPEALRGMLDHLMTKGSVSPLATQNEQLQETGCGKKGGCGQCSFGMSFCSSPSPKAEIYNWKERGR